MSDSLGGLFAIVTLSITLIVAATSVPMLARSENRPFYYSLLSFSAMGMVLLSYATDLIMLFVAWELMSLPTYALAGFDKRREESNEASAKYAILGALSSAILLYAISLSYGLAGSTAISQVVRAIAGASPSNPIALLTVLLFVVGFGFKMSIVPFHMWVPDAYEGAPITISTLFAAATKKAGFIAAIRVVLAASTVYVVTGNPVFTIANVLAVLALATMTLGNLAALTQKSMTRLLAYSSIAQAGYIPIGFVIFSYAQGDPRYSEQAVIGMTGSLFHVINHAVMVGAAFLAVAVVLLSLGKAHVGAFDGLAKRAPITAFTLALSLLRPGGVAPAERLLEQAPPLPICRRRAVLVAHGGGDNQHRLQLRVLLLDREADVHGRAREHREDKGATCLRRRLRGARGADDRSGALSRPRDNVLAGRDTRDLSIAGARSSFGPKSR